MNGDYTYMSEQLDDAKKILEEKKLLLNKYPDKFSLKIDVKRWESIIQTLD
jgi:hypothetical protein